MSSYSNSAHSYHKKGLDFIFPKSPNHGKMILMFACLSCLICLMMIAISAGLRVSDHWRHAFDTSYVLELRPVNELPVDEQIETAMIILKDNPHVTHIDLIDG